MARLAVPQHGVLSLDQARGLGLTPRSVQRRAAAGRLHRIHQGVYSLIPTELLTREGRWMAAVLACGPDAALSHRSAAALHGLRDWGGVRIDVTVPKRSALEHKGIQLHRSTTLAQQDVMSVNHIPVTTVARTLLDLADVIGRRRLERAFDQSEMLEVFDLLALMDQLERNAGRRKAVGIVRGVLNEHYVGSTLTESEFEEAFLGLVRELGVPQPEVQAWLTLPDGLPPVRADFLWRAERIVVETDGRFWHNTRQRFESNAARDQRLVVAGWRPFHVTKRQMKRERYVVAKRLIAVIRPTAA